MQLAKFNEVEQDYFWLMRLGETMIDADRVDAAIVYLSKAVDLDDSSWRAQRRLAFCYELKEDYTTAIGYQQTVFALISRPQQYYSMFLRAQVGRKLVQQLISADRYTEAMDLALDLREMDPEDEQTTKTYIEAAGVNGCYRDIYDFVQKLHAERWITADVTRFEHFLMYNTDEIGPMLKEVGAEVWFRPIGDRVMQLCLDRQLYWKYINIILMKQLYLASTDIDIERDWEPIIQPSFLETDQSTRTSLQDYASLQLSSLYLKKAVSAESTGKACSEWTEKLRNLATRKKPGSRNQQLYMATPSAVMYGHWLRKYEGANTQQSMECFQPMVLASLDKLDDNVPSNDRLALSNLGITLLMAGDTNDAVATLVATLKPLEILAEKPDRIAELRNEDNLRLWSCDGDCRTRQSQYKELHLCGDCWDISFCETCIKLVKEGRLPVRKCSATHTFVQMYPVPDKVKDVAAWFTEPDLRLVVNREWLAGMRKKWRVEGD